MPKVTYTNSKGLHQKSGSGIDFTNGAGLANRRKTIAASGGNVTLTAEDSGCVVFASGGARTVTLPTVGAAGAGWYCEVIAATAHNHVVHSGTDDVIHGFSVDLGGSTTVNGDPITGKDKVTLASPKIGDRIQVLCDGTYFYAIVLTSATATLANA